MQKKTRRKIFFFLWEARRAHYLGARVLLLHKKKTNNMICFFFVHRVIVLCDYKNRKLFLHAEFELLKFIFWFCSGGIGRKKIHFFMTFKTTKKKAEWFIIFFFDLSLNRLLLRNLPWAKLMLHPAHYDIILFCWEI